LITISDVGFNFENLNELETYLRIYLRLNGLMVEDQTSPSLKSRLEWKNFLLAHRPATIALSITTGLLLASLLFFIARL